MEKGWGTRGSFRKSKELDVFERHRMLREYEYELLTYREIAAKHRVKVSQVGGILQGVRHKPQLLNKRMQ